MTLISTARRLLLAAAALLAAPLLTAACDESPATRDVSVDGGSRDYTVDRQVLEGAPDLLLPDAPPKQSDRCGGGDLLDPSQNGGKVVIDGTTSGALNQYGQSVRCGGPTSFAGPQRYYRLVAKASETYRITLAPSFDAVVYVFQSCAVNLLNADCSSGGRAGDVSASIAAGTSQRLTFFPPSDGTFIIAVDSASDAQAGAYKLTVEAFGQPKNGRCSGAQPIKLANGAVQVTGSTLGARDEFASAVTCGLGLDLDGPQVYYSVELTGGRWYRVSLAASFEATAYVAGAGAGCVPANVEQDCSSITGTVVPGVKPGATRSGAFRPPVTGTYVVAVDSVLPRAAGTFTLAIDEYTPPSNMICSGAHKVTLVGGAALVRGDTTPFVNDRGAQMTCGAPPLTGPQAYYTVDLAAKPYLLTLTTPFDAVLALGQGCLTLPVDCTSTLSGAGLSVTAGSTGKLFFTPGRAGTYVFSVDGADPGASGKFKVEIAEASSPQGGRCQSPQTLPYSGGTLTVAGDTGPLFNDVVGVDCGGSAGPWVGPQAYYKVALRGGKTYEVELKPEAVFDPALLAFPAATGCAAAAINAACSGSFSDTKGNGVVEKLTLSPTSDADYLLVVDSWSLSEVGTFTLRIIEK